MWFVKFGEPVRAKRTIQVLHIFVSIEAIWKTVKVTFMWICDGRENDPNVVFVVNFFEEDEKRTISKSKRKTVYHSVFIKQSREIRSLHIGKT